MLKRILLLALLIFGFLITLFLLRNEQNANINQYLSKFDFKIKQSNQDTDQYIRSQMKICLENSGEDHCYRDLAYVLIDQFNLKEILESFARNETYPEIFSRCHEETHFLSRLEYQRVGSISKVYEQCDSTCHGGCYHGAVEQYLKDKNIPLTDIGGEEAVKTITKICGRKEDYSKPLHYSECIHGIGHAGMFITDMDLPKSLKICDLFSDRGERETCYSGAFMENSSSSTNNDHPGRFIKPDDPMYPCNTLEERYLPLCYMYQSSYFGFYTKWDWAKVGNLCSQVPEAYQLKCFETIGTNQVGFTQDISLMKENCGKAEEERYRSACIQGIVVALAGRYVNQEDRLLEFCQLVAEENKESCYRQIGISISQWYEQQEEVRVVCNKINSKDYALWCQEGFSI